jgi:glutamine cyclotransferase
MRGQTLTALGLVTACGAGPSTGAVEAHSDGGVESGTGGSAPPGAGGSTSGAAGRGGAAGAGGMAGQSPDAAIVDAQRSDAQDAAVERPDADDAGVGRPDARDAGFTSGTECSGPKAAAGEPCRSDFDCGAGLLCDDESRSCRAITGIRLLDSFEPAGRTDAYSEGLDFAHGSLWQSTPEQLLRIDVTRRTVVGTYPPPTDYAESLTWNGDVLYNASYENGNLYASELVNDKLSFRLVGALQMTGGCVYGIVDHCDELYVTRCGDSVVDVYATGTTRPVVRTFTVRDRQGTPLPEIEDLEIYRGQLWTSTFASQSYDRTLFRVDTSTNRAVDAYTIPCSTIAIDGVAADATTRTLYVTGKDCPIFVYRVE